MMHSRNKLSNNHLHNDLLYNQLVVIEEDYEEKKRHRETLEEQLNNLKQQCTKTEQDFTAEIAELQPYSEQLKVFNDICTLSVS